MDNLHHVVVIEDDGQFNEICDDEIKAIDFALGMLIADDELRDFDGIEIEDSELFISEA
jgi:hypothetical protein